jgi:pimeloyl-ACP methyl ester carboxylesterase
MRLAPRRWGEWLRFRDFGEELPRRVGLRSGGGEVVRMGRGAPIVLLPGLAGGWRLLAPLARQLARGHEVILLGHRGDGALMPSSVEESLARYAAEVAEVIGALRLERPTVFGVSFGGAVALELAVENPGLIGALVVMGSEARFRGGVGATIARRVLERFPLPSDNRFINQFFNLLHGGRPESPALAEFVVGRCWETDQAVMAARLRALEAFDVTDRLWRIDVPSLVLAGNRDVIVAPPQQRALAEAIAGARFEMLDGAGHVGFLTHRDEVARHVRRLVREAHGSLC